MSNGLTAYQEKSVKQIARLDGQGFRHLHNVFWCNISPTSFHAPDVNAINPSPLHQPLVNTRTMYPPQMQVISIARAIPQHLDKASRRVATADSAIRALRTLRSPAAPALQRQSLPECFPSSTRKKTRRARVSSIRRSTRWPQTRAPMLRHFTTSPAAIANALPDRSTARRPVNRNTLRRLVTTWPRPRLH